MTIVNKDSFPFIRYSSIEYRTNPWVWQLRNFNDGNNYWYCEIFNGDVFEEHPIDSIISPEILSSIKKDANTFLYICNSHEAFLDIVEPLYKSLVIDKDIPANKIIIANEAADLHIEVKRYADLHNLSYMQVEWILEFEPMVSIEARKDMPILQFFDKTPETPCRCRLNIPSHLDINRNYSKRYLNFNRRWRLHRPTLVALLKANNLLEKGHVSLGNSDDGKNWKNVYPWIKSVHSSNLELKEMIDQVEADILNMPPLYVDFTDLESNRAALEQESLSFYQDTILSVVTETTFHTGEGYNSARFLSEKTFKPVAFGHPFILVSVPKSMELFRELGYKSFHPFIDESYDYEFDDNKRLLKILREIERISHMSDEEVKKFIKHVLPIIIYNRTVLLKKSLGVGDPQCDYIFTKKTL
jgi:hypothetical protein